MNQAATDKREAFKERTRQFALGAIRFCESMPSRKVAFVITDQLVRSATSVAANYRAARRARSMADCIAKLGIVEEEADECEFWLGLAIEGGYGDPDAAALLRAESCEIVAIVVTSLKNLKARAEKRASVVREASTSDLFSSIAFES